MRLWRQLELVLLLLAALLAAVARPSAGQAVTSAQANAALCSFSAAGVPAETCGKCLERPSGRVVYVVAVDQDTTNSATWHWNEVKAGAVRAADRLGGLQVDWRTPRSRNASCAAVQEAAALIEQAAKETPRPLGLVVTASDTAACGRHIIPAMAAAKKAGIPVIAVDHNARAAVEQGGALQYVGMDNARAGREACAAMKARGGVKSMLFIDFDNGINPSINDRLAGCEDAMGGTTTSVVNVGGLPFPEQVARVAARLKENPLTNGMIVGGGWRDGTQLMLDAAKAAGRVPGKTIALATFDFSPRGAPDALKSGKLLLVVDQQGSAQGVQSVLLTYMAAANGGKGLASRYIWTGPILRFGQDAAASCSARGLAFCDACPARAAVAVKPDPANTRGLLTPKSLCAWALPEPSSEGVVCATCYEKPAGRVVFAIAPPLPNAARAGDATNFWSSIRAGALQAASLLGGLTIDWRQPVGVDACKALGETLQVVEGVSRAPKAQRPLALVVTPTTMPGCAASGQLLPALKRVREAGVPVVAINQNGPAAIAAGAAAVFVGSNETRAGSEACAALGAAGAREILLLSGANGSNPGITDRIKGCQSVPGLTVTLLEIAGKDTAAAAAAVAAQLRKQPRTGAVFLVGAGGRADALEAMQQGAKAAGRITGAPGTPQNIMLAVVDWSQAGLNRALADGAVSLVVDQRSNSQGFLPTFLAYSAGVNRQSRAADPWVLTGPTLVSDAEADLQCSSFALPFCDTAC